VSGIAIVALVAGAGAVALSRVDPEAVRDFLTDAARNATGREVVVRGATELRLFPSPTLVAENVVFGNASWSVSPDMARVKRLEARVGVLPLFFGQLRVHRFRLVEPHVLLEKDRKGRRNWDFETAGDNSPARGFLTKMHSRVRMVVSAVRIIDGTVSIRQGNRTRTLRIPDLSAYGNVAGGPLDLVGRGIFAGRGWKLSGSVGELSALLRNDPYDLDFVLSSGGMRLTGKGAISNPLDGTGLSIDLKLAGRTAREVLALAGIEADLPGAVQGSAVLTDTDHGVRVDEIDAKVRIDGGLLSVGGSVDDLGKLRGMKLTTGVEAKSLAGLSGLAGVALPKTGPVQASARITNPKGRLRMDKLSGTVHLRGATVKLSGAVKDLARRRGVNLGLDLEATSLARLSRYSKVSLPAVGPVKASARLSRTRHGYKLAKLDARIGPSDARGELYLYPHRKRLRVVGRIESKRFDLDPFLPAGRKRGSKRVFSSQPISVAWLREFDGEVSAHVQRLQVRGMRIARARVGMSLKQGSLLFTPAGKLGGGDFKARLSVDARSDRPRVAMRIRGKGIGLGKVTAQIYETEFIEGARSDVNIDVAARGGSVGELMGGLSGGIYVAAGKATIHNQRLEKLSSDVVTAVLSTVAMQSDEEETTHVRCGVVRVPVKNGRVDIDRTIAMETTRAAMSASGSIDLRDEGLDLGVKLVGRRGPSLSAGSFSGLVRVRGTMAEPRIVADAVGVAGAAATVAGAVATSGLSLIAQGLISQIAADRSTCRTALEVDNGADAKKVAFSKAGRDDDESGSPARGREQRRDASAAVPASTSSRTVDDGN
jgi:uncharacterized protein involved in outer membrane biogenesis